MLLPNTTVQTAAPPSTNTDISVHICPNQHSSDLVTTFNLSLTPQGTGLQAVGSGILGPVKGQTHREDRTMKSFNVEKSCPII